jgi:hypothetical protein
MLNSLQSELKRERSTTCLFRQRDATLSMRLWLGEVIVRCFLNQMPSRLRSRSFVIFYVLISLSCATPFPYEKLAVGMTVDAVRQEIGEPEVMKNGPDGARSEWCYEEADFGYIRSGAVLLHFEEEKLVRWENVARWTTRDSTWSHEENILGIVRRPMAGEKRYLWCDSILPTYEDTPAGPQWVYDRSTGHSEPETSCKSEQASAEARAEASGTRYVARDYVSLWLEPAASSREARMSLNRGQPLKVLARRCQWCRVEDDAGMRGWVPCVFLDRDEPL